MKKVFLLLFALLTVVTASAQMRTVKGQVVYAGDGEPLAGATILPVGGSGMAPLPMLTVTLLLVSTVQSQKSKYPMWE